MSFAKVIQEYNSVNLEYSSVTTTNTDPIHGHGNFEVNLAHLAQADKSVKVVAQRVWIPNVFNNVNAHTSQVTVVDAALAIVQQVSIATGFYTRAEYIAAFNTAMGASCVMTYVAAPTNRIQITCPANGFVIASQDWFNMVGFTNVTALADTANLASVFIDNNVTLELPVVAAVAAPVVTISSIPNFAGETLVHVALSRVSDSNCLCHDSQKRDVLLTVPLTTTPYGEYHCSVAPDTFLDDFEFRSEQSTSNARIQLLDFRYRLLPVPTNYHVTIMLKVYHVDTTNG